MTVNETSGGTITTDTDEVIRIKKEKAKNKKPPVDEEEG